MLRPPFAAAATGAGGSGGRAEPVRQPVHLQRSPASHPGALFYKVFCSPADAGCMWAACTRTRAQAHTHTIRNGHRMLPECVMFLPQALRAETSGKALVLLDEVRQLGRHP